MFFRNVILSVVVVALLMPLAFCSGAAFPKYALSCYPCSNPEINVESYVACYLELDWDDADEAPGPRLAGGDEAVWVFKYVITNTGDATLENITLEDSILGTIALPRTTLLPGESMEVTVGPYAALYGEITQEATVTGEYGGAVYSDTDLIYYYQ